MTEQGILDQMEIRVGPDYIALDLWNYRYRFDKHGNMTLVGQIQPMGAAVDATKPREGICCIPLSAYEPTAPYPFPWLTVALWVSAIAITAAGTALYL